METQLLIEMLAENARRVEVLFAGLSEADVRRAPAPNEWSAFEVLIHMRTAEAIMMPRLLQILVRPGVRVPDMDGHRWAALLARARLPVGQQVAAFAARRRELVGLLETLGPLEWATAGEHELLGELTVRGIAEHAAVHEQEHLAQIETVRQRIGR